MCWELWGVTEVTVHPGERRSCHDEWGWVAQLWNRLGFAVGVCAGAARAKQL